MIKYYGGKIWLGKQIENYLPKEDLKGFCDVFVGGGSISDILSKHYKYNLINDKDANLINFYNVAKERNGELIEYILENRNKYSMLDIKNFKNELENDEPLLRAFKYYSMIYSCFGGKPYDVPTKDKYNNYIKRNVEKDLLLCKSTLSNCSILNKDYKELIYSDILYYCDPPYYKVSSNTYYGKNGKNHKDFDHGEFAEWIKDRSKNNKIIISYEDSDYIRSLYKDFNIKEISKKTTTFSKNENNRTIDTPELLIMNY